MGASMASSSSHSRTHKSFLLCNYALLAAASACIFLTLSLRLIPSPCGLLLILLHALTIAVAVAGLAAASPGVSARWHAAHMAASVMTAILQGSASMLAFTRTSEFLLSGLRSYVREDDGVVILRMVGGLGVGIFCMEWVVLAVAFALRYYACVDGGGAVRSARVGDQKGEEEMGGLPYCPYPNAV